MRRELISLSSGPLPKGLIERLRRIPFYCGPRSALFESNDMSEAVDASMLLNNIDAFLSADAAPALTFLSGGTIAASKHIPYTVGDYDASIQATYEAIKISGGVEGRRVALLHPFAPWAIGGIFQAALVRDGAHVLPLGLSPSVDRLEKELLRFKPQVLVGPASLLVKVLSPQVAQHCKSVINAGEPLEPGLIQRFKAIGVVPYNIYGMAEFDTIAGECEEHRLHLLTEYFHFELLACTSRTKEPVCGELVVTPLQREAFAVLRYRTGDEVEAFLTPCACGRPGPTLGWVSRAGALYIDGVTITEHEIAQAVASTQLPIEGYQMSMWSEPDGTMCARLDFEAATQFEPTAIRQLHASLERVSLDWEDLIRSQSLRVLAPRQVSSLASRRTARGKLSRLVLLQGESRA